MRRFACLAVVLAAMASPARAQDPLLEESAQFTGSILYASIQPAGLVIGIVRDGESAVAGFGEARSGSDEAPDGDTLMRIGSITKVLTGAVLASMAADGTVALTDPLERTLDWGVAVPSRDGHIVRLVDLATHAGGFPREVERAPGPPDDPYATLTREAFVAQLGRPLLFAPGTGALYSNVGFDLLAQALAGAGGEPYPNLLRARVLDPAAMSATVYTPTEAQRASLFQGHWIDGTPMPDVAAGPMDLGSGGLYSTTNDMLRWLVWHLDRFDAEGAEMRMIDHAPWLPRDGLSPASGLDESGYADAIGLGWIVMAPQAGRPLILQKAGALQGIMSYIAFAPTRGVGVFVAMNEFKLASFPFLAQMANQVIVDLVPR
jgi:D-alanyl-D-alanine-carboxypeptidase/D-alanyl-D-alanine-endopeptidase